MGSISSVLQLLHGFKRAYSCLSIYTVKEAEVSFDKGTTPQG